MIPQEKRVPYLPIANHRLCGIKFQPHTHKQPKNPDFIVSSQTDPKTNRKTPINHAEKGYLEVVEE
jgi:hypothetical protein